MVTQHFKNLAFCNAFAIALSNHTFQLFLEGLKTLNPLLDLAKLPPRDRVRIYAGLRWIVGQIQKLADRVERKAQLTLVSNKSEPVEILLIISPLPT